MQVQLVAPDRMVWSGEAEIVLARTVDGELGILPRHAPLLGVLVEYPVTIRRTGEDDLVAAVHGGFLSVSESASTCWPRSSSSPTRSTCRGPVRRWSGQGSDDAAEGKAAARRATARLRAAGETV